ncbi:hypothetical protein ACN28G_13145 [Micromonospora sp. WMMA1923]|uniref:hypothetical protein n=1 Tax=Micromonospora sp. WMMA1923 TaxID=3404125 RepID=UPI003B93A9C4
MTISHRKPTGTTLTDRLNAQWHRPALWGFTAVVIAHWAEHLVQAAQIWLLGWPVPQARGLLGQAYPWLVQQEWLHYGYALVMLVGLWMLRRGFTGRARTWWLVALGIQFFHHIEHLLLLVQYLSGAHLLGRPVQTSLLQLVIPRVELHLFYNAIVFLPMVVAMYLHVRPTAAEQAASRCYCAPRRRGEPAGVAG